MEQDVPSSAPVIIDERAITLIKDNMRRTWVSGPAPDIATLAIETLFDFIAQRGGKPGFELRVKK